MGTARLKHKIEEAGNFEFFLPELYYEAPKYKISFWVVHLPENGVMAGISSHSVKIQYCLENDGTEKIEQNYSIDDNMLSSLHRDKDYIEILKKIAKNLKKKQQEFNYSYLNNLYINQCSQSKP